MSNNTAERDKLHNALRMIAGSLGLLDNVGAIHARMLHIYQYGGDTVQFNWDNDVIQIDFLIEGVSTTFKFVPGRAAAWRSEVVNMQYVNENHRDVGRLVSFWQDAAESMIDLQHE